MLLSSPLFCHLVTFLTAFLFFFILKLRAIPSLYGVSSFSHFSLVFTTIFQGFYLRASVTPFIISFFACLAFNPSSSASISASAILFLSTLSDNNRKRSSVQSISSLFFSHFLFSCRTFFLHFFFCPGDFVYFVTFVAPSGVQA